MNKCWDGSSQASTVSNKAGFANFLQLEIENSPNSRSTSSAFRSFGSTGNRDCYTGLRYYSLHRSFVVHRFAALSQSSFVSRSKVIYFVRVVSLVIDWSCAGDIRSKRGTCNLSRRTIETMTWDSWRRGGSSDREENLRCESGRCLRSWADIVERRWCSDRT